ncbi:hypothetical protein A5739_12200 [Mycobacterium colombiense]|uniref:hypothetical protein n=1 Tax=Mycobacterium colombiense TaxID=339268 RepID=UPI00096E84E4|nr:hypothetical protein [Mycobacterium colombiense]OMB94151.1 hypothetical protein A5732_14200 [Mycobacterium colombiense]OMC31743.1 hypothetical protein A5739_12200 [Mycobacterium colombiense]
MTGPHSEAEGPGTRPISVAELLARNGTIGAPAVTRRRRRRRGDSDSVTVAELTGDLPVIRDDDDEPARNANEATDTIDAVDAAPPAAPPAREAVAEPVTKAEPRAPYWSEPEPRWPKSPPQPKRAPGPERSEYPRPLPEAGPSGSSANGTGQGGSGAEDMSFDPLDHYADVPVDVMDSEVREAEPALEDSAYVRSFLRSGDDEDDEDGSGPLPAGVLGDDHLDLEDREADAAADAHPEQGRFDAVWRGGVVVLQSMLAVAFGGGLFVAFDQLWRWNSLVALVLSVLVILGLVAGVRVVRKTEDIASTLIAVAVGALITLGPLALSLQSG